MSVPVTARVLDRARRLNWKKLALFVASLLLFILAIQLLKEGAKGLVPFIRGSLRVDNMLNALGFGWLFAYLVLSGSPVAAATLAFFDAGAFDETSAFAMIAGSRLGAAFIVLFIGFLYTLRGHRRQASLSMGLLSLTVTQAVYVPALAIGYWVLRNGWLNAVRWHASAEAASVVDWILDPVIRLVVNWLPRGAIFALGLAVILASFAVFDRALPDLHLRDSAFARLPRLLYRPIVTFLLGAAITTISMSVSLSLGVLVPLSVRGYIRRENVIPYIMGANVTTFIDTLVAAILLNNPAAFTVVLVEMLSVAFVSLAVILLAYRPFEHGLLAFVERLSEDRRALAAYMFVIVGAPVALMLIR